MLQMRLRIYQSYINDLTDQNAVLVKTVEDLEADANTRVKRLETKLHKATATAKVHDCCGCRSIKYQSRFAINGNLLIIAFIPVDIYINILIHRYNEKN